MNRLVTFLLLASVVTALSYPYFDFTAEIQRPGDKHIIDRVFTGNTPGLKAVLTDDGEPWNEASDGNWTWTFKYYFNQYDTNGAVEIDGVVVSGTNEVNFLGSTNIFFQDHEYYFSLSAMHTAGYTRTFATGKMIQEYDPATDTNYIAQLSEINMDWWTNNVGLQVSSNTARIVVLEASTSTWNTVTGKLDITTFNTYTNIQAATNTFFTTNFVDWVTYNAFTNEITATNTYYDALLALTLNTTTVFAGDVGGVYTNLQIGEDTVGLTEVDTTSLDTRYLTVETNIFESLTVRVLADQDTNIVVNGTFATDTDWIYTGGAAYGSSRMEMLSGTSGTISPSNNLPIVYGKTYLIEAQTGTGSSTNTFALGGQSWSTTENGYVSNIVTIVDSSTNLVITMGTTALAGDWLDNVSVTEITNGNIMVAGSLYVGGDLIFGGVLLPSDSITNWNEAYGWGDWATNYLDAGNVTGVLTAAVQDAITGVGVLTGGTWNAIVIDSAYLDANVVLNDQNNTYSPTTTQFMDNASVSNLLMNPISTPSYIEGLVFYDSDNDVLTLYNDEPDVAMDIGQEMWIKVRNNSGSTITNGKAVYISGAIGQYPTIALAKADSEATSKAIAIATHDIENNTLGYVTTFGIVRDVDTTYGADGVEVYVSATAAGELTSTLPTGTNIAESVGYVAYSHNANGKLLVNITPHVDAADIHDPNDMFVKTDQNNTYDSGTTQFIDKAVITNLHAYSASGNTPVLVESGSAQSAIEIKDSTDSFYLTMNGTDQWASLGFVNTLNAANINMKLNGYVGMGIADPQTQLDVNGTIRGAAHTGNGVQAEATPVFAPRRDDLDTGLWSPAYNTLAWSVNAAEKMRLTETLLSVDTAVTVNDSGADRDFRIESDTETHALFVQGSDGNVGIGTNAPASALVVVGDIVATDGLGLGGSAPAFVEGVNGIDIEAAGVATIRMQDALSSQSIEIVNDGANDIFKFRPYNALTYQFMDSAGNVDMTILSGGNVGIGTDAPAAKLHVAEGSSGVAAVADSYNTIIVEGDNAPGITFMSSTNPVSSSSGLRWNNPNGDIYGEMYLVYNYDDNQAEFAMRRANADIVFKSGYSAEAMRILANGNLGIGTNAPAAKLHLGGTGLANGIQFGDDVALYRLQANYLTTPDYFYSSSAVSAPRFDGSYNSDFISRVTGSDDTKDFIWQNRSASELMRLDVSSGYLGIGTNAPAAKLHVAGTMQVDDLMCEADFEDDATQDFTGVSGFEVITNFQVNICDAGYTATGSNATVLVTGRYRLYMTLSYDAGSASEVACHFYTNGVVATSASGNILGWSRSTTAAAQDGVVAFEKTIPISSGTVIDWRIDTGADETLTWKHGTVGIERR